MERKLIEADRKLQTARGATILGLAKLAEYRDMDTGLHLERMREYSKLLAQALSDFPAYKGYITNEYIDDVFNSSILHDIGKVGIPDSILLKPARLTPEEFEIMKSHARLGGEAIELIESETKGQSFLTIGREIAFYHHEKWDGSGYPKGLRGEDIPLSARLIALADVYDALTSKRVYKEPLSHEEVKAMILEDKGKHFAPEVVDAFLAQEEKFKAVRLHMKDSEQAGLMHD
ncbi:MAG: HD domain-containing protein [Desulfobacteraceae bacterium]|nr:MAG: HD domain-containing protein [Desulfobacteraceae bacterium]